MWWVTVKKTAKSTISGIRDADGRCGVPVYVGKRGAPKGNRNAEREGFHNREAKAQRAQYAAVLKSARNMIKEAKLLLLEIRLENRLRP
jgi:hypothetical protein